MIDVVVAWVKEGRLRLKGKPFSCLFFPFFSFFFFSFFLFFLFPLSFFFHSILSFLAHALRMPALVRVPGLAV